ncbi:arsenic resistance protein [Fischerella thermalis]|uniref:arsenic resistance protein n=1 Tax=Fischerella thermalis TaxID=372787 RepID=UPI00241F4199|nr:bile acid:sodium symporter [Fischerella thermalis]
MEVSNLKWTEKFQSLLVIAAIFIGLALGQIPWFSKNTIYLIVPALIVMLYGVFLNTPLNRLGNALQNYKVTGLSLGINFLWTPFFAWGLGAIFLRDTPDLWVGLIMLMVTPCTDWYLIFTRIAKGDVTLATALLPWNLLLQVILLPIYLLIFAGKLVNINTLFLLENVVLVLVIPLLLALISKRLIQKNNHLGQRIMLKIAANQTVFLTIAIAAMFASQGQILMQRPDLLLKMLMPVLIFFGVNFWLGQLIGHLAKFSYEEVACFNCTTLARNSPIALAIATSTFGERPLIALALVIGPLIELPVMVLVSQSLLRLRHQK